LFLNMEDTRFHRIGETFSEELRGFIATRSRPIIREALALR